VGMSDIVYTPGDDDGVARVFIDRSSSGNSLTPEVARAIGNAVAEAGREARCVVLESSGRVFCSGADVTFLDTLLEASKEEISSSIYANFQAMIRSIVECPVPVIARLQGAAAGAGCDLVLACDYVVASEAAWLEESWIKIGATSALAGAFHLTQRAGSQRALDLLISSRRLGAIEAQEFGVVYRTVASEDLDEAIDELTGEICARDRLAVGAMKSLVRSAQRSGFEEALTLGLELQSVLLARPEFAAYVGELRQRLAAKSNA
jgi:2-(1,2-epoxy-1,2-dihydrophenyl)acetyl-CoA isomerase